VVNPPMHFAMEVGPQVLGDETGIKPLGAYNACSSRGAGIGSAAAQRLGWRTISGGGGLGRVAVCIAGEHRRSCRASTLHQRNHSGGGRGGGRESVFIGEGAISEVEGRSPWGRGGPASSDIRWCGCFPVRQESLFRLAAMLWQLLNLITLRSFLLSFSVEAQIRTRRLKKSGHKPKEVI